MNDNKGIASDIEKLSFEDALAKLEEASLRLKAQNISLEESTEVYRNSILLFNRCRKLLDEAKQNIQIYKPETGTTEDFGI